MQCFFRFTLMCIFLCLPVSLWAHGDAIHILGTVTEATSDHVVIKTPKGKTLSITLHPETTFRQNGIVNQDARPQIGDRLIAEAAKKGDTLIAEEIRFSSPNKK